MAGGACGAESSTQILLWQEYEPPTSPMTSKHTNQYNHYTTEHITAQQVSARAYEKHQTIVITSKIRGNKQGALRQWNQAIHSTTNPVGQH